MSPPCLTSSLSTRRIRLLPPAGTAPAGVPDNQTVAVNPRPPTYALRFFLILGRISRTWGLLGCWTALTYFIATTSHGANVFRSLSNRFTDSSFLMRLISYLFRWFGYEAGSVDRAADTVDHIGTFFRHAVATLKSARDVVNKISSELRGSPAVFGENNHASNSQDLRTVTSDVATQVDSPRADDDDLERTFSSDQRVNTVIDNSGSHGARAGVEQKIISSIGEGKEVISQWKEGSAEFCVDIPPNMPAHTALKLKECFRDMGADCLLQGPNIKSILAKEPVSAISDLEVATKNVEDL